MFSRLYSKEELLSLYRQSIENNEAKLVKAINPAPLTPFRLTNIIDEDQEADWKSLAKDCARRKLIAHVLEKDAVDIYIKFSRCVQYIDNHEAKRIFTFIPDLIEAGLHDPLQAAKGSISLKARSSGSQQEPVMLWIVGEETFFNDLNGLIEGIDYSCSDVQGYICKKSKTCELYSVHSKSQVKAPGRKFDGLLAQFKPIPTMLVYSGSCQLNSDTSSLATADYVVLSDNLGSQFDLSTEAMHAVELCKLRRWRDHDPDFITKLTSIGRATRFAGELGGSVPCPDAVTFLTAARTCETPALAIVKVESGDSSANDRDCNYVHNIVKELVDNL